MAPRAPARARWTPPQRTSTPLEAAPGASAIRTLPRPRVNRSHIAEYKAVSAAALSSCEPLCTHETHRRADPAESDRLSGPRRDGAAPARGAVAHRQLRLEPTWSASTGGKPSNGADPCCCTGGRGPLTAIRSAWRSQDRVFARHFVFGVSARAQRRARSPRSVKLEGTTYLAERIIAESRRTDALRAHGTGRTHDGAGRRLRWFDQGPRRPTAPGWIGAIRD